jgi:pyruvate ferredoxin oxidoreductase alpha subunit
MPQRDTGWVQLFAESGQDVFDLILQAFRLAEDHRVLLPVMVNMDGFTLSHVIEPVSLLTDQGVSRFLPAIDPFRVLDVEKPRSIGPFGAQDVYTEIKQQQEAALLAAEDVLEETWQDFDNLFGRRYRGVETYRIEDAEVVLVTMGAIGETARTAVAEMRDEGISVGLARIRLWRPFPCTPLLSALENANTIAVIDRVLSPGAAGGPVATEIRSLFYGRSNRPDILNFISGLGGREISRRTFKEITKRAQSRQSQPRNYTLIDVRLS